MEQTLSHDVILYEQKKSANATPAPSETSIAAADASNESAGAGVPSCKRLHFVCDYEEGAHPRIMEALTRASLEHNAGYGLDAHTEHARALIREACGTPDAEIQILVGGTQTNSTLIDALLPSYQGVISVAGGHITGHEAGAVEFLGHKVLEVEGIDGKLTANSVHKLCESWEQDENRDHMVMPGLAYISQPTEQGTLYSLAELEALRVACYRHGLKLYVDGARLASALATPENDVSLKDLGRLADAFYIGGTKCGCLFGEAVVIPNPDLIPHFFSVIKQHGALLAKGFVAGIQFETLFEDGLYEHVCEPAIHGARRIQKALEQRGLKQALPSTTNQTFVTLPDATLAWLSDRVAYDFWERVDAGHTTIRFCTSWATKDEDVDALLELIAKMPLE